MALSSSPRKIIPLSTGDETRSRCESSVPGHTKRVFFCGVVVEGSENGRRLPEGTNSGIFSPPTNFVSVSDIQDLVLSLGDTVASSSDPSILSSPQNSSTGDPVSILHSTSYQDCIQSLQWFYSHSVQVWVPYPANSTRLLCPMNPL